jgi:hypothetical protein
MNKNWTRKPDYQTNLSTFQWILLIAATFSLGLGIAGSLPPAERFVILRYVYFIQAAVLAFVTPWILFPQKPLYLFLATNPTNTVLFRVLTGRLTSYFVGFVILVTTVALADFDVSLLSVHMLLLVDGILFTAGMFAFASYRFLKMGQVSQLWQEGNRGKQLLEYMKEAGSGPGVPAGSLPTIGTTSLVALVGMIAVVFGAYMYSFIGVQFHALGGLSLLLLGSIGWSRRYKKIDVDFYHTHAFYNELFRNPGGVADAGRDPLPMKALYWVPSPLKPLVWISLRQMDRKIPVGRLLLITFLLFWSFIYGGFLGIELLFIFPIVVIFGKNAAVLRLTTDLFAPSRFQQLLASPLMWFLARCFINLRWILLLHFFTLLTVWFVDSITMNFWYIWIGIDVLAAIIIPGIITWKKEGRIKYQYA